MASDVFYNRVPYTQRRAPPHDLLASPSNHASTSSLPPSVGTSRSAGTLTFPPLYLDPFDASHPADANPPANAPAFVLGSTFYHHPSLNALVSHHLVDAFATTASAPHTTLLNTNRDDDDSEADDHDAAALGVPRPKITSEFVSLNEDLVPASLDMQGDMLPADTHPSYPFGNLFGPLGGAIAADSAIVGGAHAVGSSLTDSTAGLDFGGGLAGFVRLGSSSHGRRSAVSNGGNGFINKASRTKLVGSSSTNPTADDHTESVTAAKKLDLSPNLLFRTNTATVLAPPEWPFRRHGPGSTSYAALLRPSSNVFGSSPASQALAATLGGLPASAKILKEVWSDLALEELVPTDIGESSAVRHLEPASPEPLEGGEKRGQKRARTDPEADSQFAKRIASIEPDPLDLLGPVSREIRGQASQPWGTATRQQGDLKPRRRRRAYSAQSDDSAVEAEHDPDIFAQRDLVRYSFALPPAKFGWTESPDDTDAEAEGTTHVEEDGIGWSTAKRIFVGEERDRLLPEVASRGTGAGVEAYRVSGWRANAGVMPRGGWRWGDGAVEEVGEESLVTEGEASTSRGTDRPQLQEREVSDSEGGYADEGEWEQGAEDEELQRALLLQYQRGRVGSEADRASQGLGEDEEVVDEDEAQVEHDLDAHYAEEEDVVVDDDEDVESFGEEGDTA